MSAIIRISRYADREEKKKFESHASHTTIRTMEAKKKQMKKKRSGCKLMDNGILLLYIVGIIFAAAQMFLFS